MTNYFIGDIQIPNQNIINFSLENKLTEDNNFIEAGVFLSSATISFYDFRDSTTNEYVFIQRISRGEVYSNQDFFSLKTVNSETDSIESLMCCFDWSYEYERKIVKISLYDYTYNWKNIKIDNIVYPIRKSELIAPSSGLGKYYSEIKTTALDFFNKLVDITYKLFDVTQVSSNFNKFYISELTENQLNFIAEFSDDSMFRDSFLNAETLFDLWDSFCKTFQCCMYVSALGIIKFLFTHEKKLDNVTEIVKSKILSLDIDISSNTIITNTSANMPTPDSVIITGTSRYNTELIYADNAVANKFIPSFIENPIILTGIEDKTGDEYYLDDSNVYKTITGIDSYPHRYFSVCWGQIRLHTPFLDLSTLTSKISVDYTVDVYKYTKTDVDDKYEKTYVSSYDKSTELKCDESAYVDVHSYSKSYSVKPPMFFVGSASSSSFYSFISRCYPDKGSFRYPVNNPFENGHRDDKDNVTDYEKRKYAAVTFKAYDGTSTVYSLNRESPILRTNFSTSYFQSSYALSAGGLIFCNSSTADLNESSSGDVYEYIGDTTISSYDDVLSKIQRQNKIVPKKCEDGSYLYDVIYYTPSTFIDVVNFVNDTSKYAPLPLATNVDADLKYRSGTYDGEYHKLSDNSIPMLNIELKFSDRGSQITKQLFNDNDLKIGKYILSNTVDIRNNPSLVGANSDIERIQKLVYYWNCDGNLLATLKYADPIELGSTIKLPDFDKLFRVTSRAQASDKIYTYNLVEIFKRDLDYNLDHTYFKVLITEKGKNNIAVFRAALLDNATSINMYIDWGDGTSSINYDNNLVFTHTYNDVGSYTILVYTSDQYIFTPASSGKLLGDNIYVESFNFSARTAYGVDATAADVAKGYFIYNSAGVRIEGTHATFGDINTTSVFAPTNRVLSPKQYYDKDGVAYTGTVKVYKGD